MTPASGSDSRSVDWQGWTLDLGVDADSWPRVTGCSPPGEVLVSAPSPWRVREADRLGTEIEVSAIHPSGARMRIRQSIDESWDIRIAVAPPSEAMTSVEVPGPVWRFGTDSPVQVWTAGAEGLALTDRDPQDPAGRRIVWRQIVGDSSLDVEGIRPLGESLTLEPGRTRTALWRATPVDDVASAAARLPSWLPDELLVDPAVDQEIWLDTPDAGLLLDGAPSDQWLSPGTDSPTTDHDVVHGLGHDVDHGLDHDVMHEVQVRQARGTTRLMVGWAMMARDHARRRAEEILEGMDPRLVTGAQLWILLQATPVGAVRGEDVVAAVAESLENRLARPGADFFTVVSAITVAAQIGDADIWESAMEGLASLPAEAPGTLIGHALARSRALLHDWQVPAPRSGRADDPLVRAERSVLLRPGPVPNPGPNPGPGVDDGPDADALAALWWLGSALPVPGPRPLMGRTGPVDPIQSAWASAICSFWPQWWQIGPDWGVDVTRLRQRTARRLLLDPELRDETLALLLW